MGLSYNYAVVDMRRAQSGLLEQIIKVASANGGYVWFTNNEVVQKEEEEEGEEEEEQSLFKDRALSDRPATSTASQSWCSSDDEEKVKLDMDPATVSYASSTDEEKVKLDLDPASVSSYASSADCDCEVCAETGESELVTRLGAIADAMSKAFDRKMGEGKEEKEEQEKEKEEQEEKEKEEQEKEGEEEEKELGSSEQQPSLDSETDLNTARSAASFFEKNEETARSNSSICEQKKDKNQSLTLRRQPPLTATEPYAYIEDDGKIVSVAATSAISKLLTSQRALLSTIDAYKTQQPTGDFAVLEAAARSVCNVINVLIKRDYKSTPTDDI